jgi:hypothetical protein
MRFRLTLLWARTGYRPWARLLHRLNLHHTRRHGPFEDGTFAHRCDWCGVSRRETPMHVTARRMRESATAGEIQQTEEG